MKRIFLTAFLFFCASLFFVSCKKKILQPSNVKVGLLHSLTGAMAESEIPVCDAERMAIEEINAKGGILGKKIEIVQEDGESNAEVFATKAQKLLAEDKCSFIFGCWTSAARKALLPVLEDDDLYGLLYYPLQYEGMEASSNIIYLGAAPNQQVIPAFEYCVEHFGKKVFLVGSDYVFPRTANKIIKAQLDSLQGQCLGEYYVVLESNDFADIVSAIKETAPDFILNTLNGSSNRAFFEELKKQELNADDIPVMSFSISEAEVSSIGPELLKNHLVTWSYFQTIESEENKTFVERYKKRFGANRLVGEPVANGYTAVYLWALACEKAGSFDVEDVRMASKGLSFSAPEGKVTIDGENQHLFKQVRIGQINEKGLVDEIWNAGDLVKPDPYLSTYVWAKGF